MQYLTKCRINYLSLKSQLQLLYVLRGQANHYLNQFNLKSESYQLSSSVTWIPVTPSVAPWIQRFNNVWAIKIYYMLFQIWIIDWRLKEVK